MLHPYLENSIILSKFINAVDSSIAIKLINIFGNWCRGSFLYRMFKKVAAKDPVFSFSMTYKAIRFVAAKVDRFAGLVHDRVSAAFGASVFGRLCMAFAAESKSNPCRIMAVALLSFSAGYSFVVIAKGLWSIRSLFIILALAFLSLVLFAVGYKWKSLLSNSVLMRFLKYIID